VLALAAMAGVVIDQLAAGMPAPAATTRLGFAPGAGSGQGTLGGWSS